MVSNAKANSCLIIPSSVVSLVQTDSCYNTFGSAGATVHYELLGASEIDIRYDDLQRIGGDRASGEIRFKPSGCYDLLSYQDSLLCFIAAALTSNMDPELIQRKLFSFKGVMGRMSAALMKQRILIDNSNSGVQDYSIKRAVDFGLTFKRPGHRVVLVIGEEAKNICDGIMPEVVASIAGNDALDEVVLVGDRMHTSKTHSIHSDDLESALRAALNLTGERDVIISCVKMWR
jgi:UDP-N-acetylmuramyl pentapeptide synthase